MKKINVIVEHSGKNFAAYVEELPGCTTTASSAQELDKNMREAIAGHLEVMKEYGDKIPAVFNGKYELIYKYEPEALMSIYKGVFTNTGLERITGINSKQLSHYGTGLKKPRTAQKEKIVHGLHELGRQLLSVEMR
ncbi:MAG: type II toxin-antitoxin system HicB family antitoxin [Bacteroidetes bacterium]|nr:type II toxin-antitoxin system HicB family antitoxin [Bacteroidota bacterium]